MSQLFTENICKLKKRDISDNNILDLIFFKEYLGYNNWKKDRIFCIKNCISVNHIQILSYLDQPSNEFNLN